MVRKKGRKLLNKIPKAEPAALTPDETENPNEKNNARNGSRNGNNRHRHSVSTLSKIPERGKNKRKNLKKGDSQHFQDADQKKGAPSKQKKPARDKRLPLIAQVVGSCYACNSNARYYKGFFFCKKCRRKFEKIVLSSKSVICPNAGACPPENRCNFCFAELVYRQGVRANDVHEFHHNSSSIVEVEESLESLHMNEEDKEFCNFLSQTFTCVIDWIWKQGDLMKITLKDRITLLEKNIGRARLMWLTLDAAQRHNVIKASGGYLSIQGFSSAIIRKAVADIYEIAVYLSSLSLSPQQIYFVKLLSLFQIGKSVSCSFSNRLYSSYHTDEQYFERGDEIKVFAANYRRIMAELKIAECDIQLIIGFIDLMQCVNELLSRTYCIDDILASLEQWISLNPEWDEETTEEIPPSLKSYSEERHKLSNYLSRKCLQMTHDIDGWMKSHFSSRDKRQLLSINSIPLLIISASWNLVPVLGDVNTISDSFVKSFWSELKEIQKTIGKQLHKYITLFDMQTMIFTQNFSNLKICLEDINPKSLSNCSKNALVERTVKTIKKSVANNMAQREEIKKMQSSLELVMQSVERLSETLISSQKELPLLFNVRSWLTETQ